MTIKFTIHMLAIPKGRPRCTCRNGKPAMYTPDATRGFEDAFRLLSKAWWPDVTLSGGIRLTARFFFPKPKSVKRVLHTVKPDLDNLIKSLTDSAERVFFDNDAQIFELHATKAYGSPRVEVELEEIAA